MIALIRTYLARRRLQRIIDRERQSYRIEQYRRHRAAAKDGWQRRKMVA